MKELSIEDKAKRYDEAVGKLRGMMPNWERLSYNGKTFLQDLTYIFPELKESEDERIRKYLLSWVETMSDMSFERTDFDRQDVRAWLEKQGKKDEEILVLKDQIESLHAAIKALKEVHKIELENQGEQKPVEQCDTNKEFSEAVSEKIRNMVSRLFNGDGNITSKEFADQFALELLTLAKYEVQKEQKFAWSEEDEEMCKKVETAIDSYYAPFSRDAEEMSEWFKNLKDRVQPKQDWSEEDEVKMNRIVGCLENLNVADNDILLKDVDWLKNRLKFLRPQNTWKPSDRELGAIFVAIGDERQKGSDVAKELLNIYQHLKKLRVE